eukprot:CAMPEP_0118653124 /NCGR_PEP_ID=MMETSP0785-20121206/11671_1 /TAXON_ID=91992 /ORGANISM="Bolidomonas pacifica, Strain CCMP 1866" /LENGTH=334 /DNA_ID=CAMNT_0006545661 /DNA_START=247 /DNA_END=1251 /DNA_ORIENTATION=+
MAENAKECPWPKTPPHCDMTWTERIGSGTLTGSKIFFCLAFGVLLVISIRGFVWSQRRLAIKKKSFFERSANEWINLYMLAIAIVRIIQELGHMSTGPLGYKTSYVLTKFISGTLICCLYTIAWGWYKVILPKTDKAKKVARADKIHTLFRCISLFSEVGFGIVAIIVLDEKDAEAGVYNGTLHGISRVIMWVCAAMLVYFITHIGLKIKNMLATGGSKAKVAPEASGAPKEAKKKTDEEKIAHMVKWTLGIMGLVLLYLIKDIKDSMGVVRHVIEPLCSAKNAFVRLPSFIQLLASYACCYVFPVKPPDKKTGKTGMMGTTVTTTTSSVADSN